MSGTTTLSRWTTRLTAFEELTNKWKPVQLSALQKDDDLVSIENNKEKLTHSRRVVSQKTKEFAKYSDEEKLAELVPLVKSYQAHVDDLTRCLKHVEQLYVELMQRVRTMTDPYPMMEKFAREKQTILDFIRCSEELEEARRTIGEREAELMSLKNQEVTVAELRDALAQAEMDKASAMEESANEVNSEWQQILRQYQQKEASTSAEIATLKQDVLKWKLSHKETSAQLAAVRSKLDDLECSREKEISALIEELDGVNIALAQKEKELRRAIAGSPEREAEHQVTLSHADETPSRTSFRAAHLMMEEHIASLQQAHDRLWECIEQRQAAWIEERDHIFQACSSESSRLRTEWQSSVQRLMAELDAAKEEIASQKCVTKSVEQDLVRCRQALCSVEAELQTRDLHQVSSEAKPPVATHHPFSLETIVGHNVTEQTVPSGGDDTFIAIAAQRDKLRQRLLALEEASSTEIHRLQMEVNTLRHSHNPQHSVLVAEASDDDGNAATDLRRPLLLFRDGRLQLTADAVVDLLDRGNILLSRTILSKLQWRRCFVGYLAALHLYLVLCFLFGLIFG